MNNHKTREKLCRSQSCATRYKWRRPVIIIAIKIIKEGSERREQNYVKRNVKLLINIIYSVFIKYIKDSNNRFFFS